MSKRSFVGFLQDSFQRSQSVPSHSSPNQFCRAVPPSIGDQSDSSFVRCRNTLIALRLSVMTIDGAYASHNMAGARYTSTIKMGMWPRLVALPRVAAARLARLSPQRGAPDWRNSFL